MKLTDVAIRSAKPKPNPYKISDGKGLYLLVTPAGGKLWRLKFRVDGKEKLLAFGSYPEVTLSDARVKREEARGLLKSAVDPALAKQEAKHRKLLAAGNTFGEVGRAYLDKRKREGMAERTTEKAEYYLSRLTRSLGTRPVAKVRALDVLAMLRVYENQGKHETATRARASLSSTRISAELTSMMDRFPVFLSPVTPMRREGDGGRGVSPSWAGS